MSLSDAQVLRQFLVREQRWVRCLHGLRSYHEEQMGKTTSRVGWIGGEEMGRFSWLGFFWVHEMFWFGYGLRNGTWQPLIEADNRSRFSSVFESMKTELCGTWESVATEGNLYRRLWSDAAIAGNSETELEWFKSRSRELHEFLVQPAN